MMGQGCSLCSEWISAFDKHELVQLGDCADSFMTINSYFNVRLYRCPRCDATWLEGYHEDFTDVPIEEEWGKRTWLYGTLTSEQIGQINAARGTRLLDLKDFAS